VISYQFAGPGDDPIRFSRPTRGRTIFYAHWLQTDVIPGIYSLLADKVAA
jgi:hypothetical protein